MEQQQSVEVGASTFSAPDDLTEDQLCLAYTRHILAACNNNKTRAAKRLGIDRRSLYRRLEKGAQP